MLGFAGGVISIAFVVVQHGNFPFQCQLLQVSDRRVENDTGRFLLRVLVLSWGFEDSSGWGWCGVRV